MGSQHKKYALTPMIISFLFFIPSTFAFPEQSTANILILNSYHQGEDWTDNEIAGIFTELKARYPTLVPFVEALDTKRYPSPDHLDLIKDYLARKYHDRTIDLIIALDNPALDLITQNPTDLFPDVPVVFAGVNGFNPEMIAGRKKITGVIERQDVAGTLRMALTMHPDVTRVLAVHDYTSSGLAVRQETETAFARFSGQLDIRYSENIPFDALGEELKRMPENGLVLILTYVTDKTGRIFTREESTRLICSLSPVPVYAMHETRLGHGIMGGFLLEGNEHGRQAARLALRILQGEDPDKIAVEDSHSRLILDHDGLRRFKIPEKTWPGDALVVNRPVSFWNRYRKVLLPSIALFLVLSGLLSILLVTVIRLHKAKTTLHKSEEKYRVLFDSFPLGITVSDKDGKIIEANARASIILNVPREDHVQRQIDGEQWHIIRPDGTPMPSDEYASVRALKEKHLVENIEMGIVKADSGITWLNVTAAPLHLEELGVVISYGDITDRKRAEEERKIQLAEKEILLREVHHRVKNNIANIESLLTIQSDSTDNPETKASLEKAISRVQCTRVLYEKLLLSKDYQDISIKNYLESLIASIVMVFDSRKNILIDQQLADFMVTSRKAISVGIIVNELLTNIFKYAFKDGADGKVSVSIDKAEDRVTLLICDNGVGIDERILSNKSPGFGLTLVRMLVEQMDGTYSIVNENGTKSVVQFSL